MSESNDAAANAPEALASGEMGEEWHLVNQNEVAEAEAEAAKSPAQQNADNIATEGVQPAAPAAAVGGKEEGEVEIKNAPAAAKNNDLQLSELSAQIESLTLRLEVARRSEDTLKKNEEDLKKIEREAAAEIGHLRQIVADLEKQLALSQEREMLWKILCQKRLSFASFSVDDFALFLPLPSRPNIFQAFNRGAPNYFLSNDCVEGMVVQGKHPDSIVGQIIAIDENVASAGNNPFDVPLGTKFFIVMISSGQ